MTAPSPVAHVPRLARTDLLLAVTLVAGIGLVLGLPIARLFGVALERGLEGALGTLGEPAVAGAIGNTAWTGVAVAVLATGAGTALALLTERTAAPGRRWLRLLVAAPLVVPPFVTAFGWARAFGPRGLSDLLIGVTLPGLYGPLGIVLVLAVAATPLSYLILAGALASRVEPDVEWAARASGAGPLTTIRTITLPLLRPALVSSLVVAFVFAANAFGVPAVLGTPAGFLTVTTRLYQDLALSADPAAFVRSAVLASTLVVLALAVVGAADRLFAARAATRTGLPSGGSGGRRGGRVLVVLAGSLVALAVILPLAALVLAALTRAAGLPPVPANWTLANFGQAIDGRFVAGLRNSALLAVTAATLVLPLGALAALGARRAGRGWATVVTLGFAVPGSALAIGVLLAYGAALRNTLAIILVAYVAKFWALGQRQVAGALDRLPPDQLRAARSSGAGAWDAIRSVAMPALRPALLAGWLTVFLFALHELTMSSLLYGPGTATLAVVVLNVQQLGDPTVSAALAVLLALIVGVVSLPLALLGAGARFARRR